MNALRTGRSCGSPAWILCLLLTVLGAAPAAAQESAWTLKATTGPSARSGHAMVYDSVRGRVVLFGGFNGTTRLGDTWEWDGAVWTQRATTGPTPRVLGPAMAYDSARRRTVLFGGFDGVYRGDTWEWDGAVWTQRADTGPSGRNAHALVYDAARARVVLFGGGGGASDTWEWDGNAWTERQVPGPSGRGGHGMVYDPARAVTVLFGGRFGTDYRSDTWTWNGAVWVQPATTGPSARYQHAMACQDRAGLTLLFGGYFNDGTPHNYADTWEWDGAAWTQRAQSGPSTRGAHAMAYDSALDKVILFGGTDGTMALGDTWEWARTYQTEIVDGYLVAAPNGNRLWTKIIQPRAALYPGRTFPAVVSVPGGIGAGDGGNLQIASTGFVEFHFNAEGRGNSPRRSDGAEDYNGFAHQDDLKTVVEFAHARANVQGDNIGVVTNSYGITMGAGCLGRYPTLPVKYLIDNEGPCDNYVTCFEPWALDADPSNDRHQLAYNIFGHWSITRDPSPPNLAWWSQREATAFIGAVRSRYLRVQAQWDHAQPPNAQWPVFNYPPQWYQGKHGVDMANLAALGAAPWTRVNGTSVGNLPNQTYDMDHPPLYYPGNMASGSTTETRRLIREMADMPPLLTLPCAADYNHDGFLDGMDYDLFNNDFESPDPAQQSHADYNGDGFVDGIDYDLFNNDFAAGC